VCCRNVVHRDGSEASCAKWIDIHIFIFSQFDNGQTETVKAELILANQKICVINMKLKDHYEVGKNSLFQLLTLIGVIIWYTIKYD